MKKFLLLSLGLLSCSLCSAQVWWPVSYGENQFYAIDLASIRKAGDLVYVWEKWWCYDEESRLKESRRKTEDWEDIKYLDYDHTLSYDVYDISGARYKSLELIHYNTKGSVIYSYSREESETKYELFVPGSVGMAKFESLIQTHRFEVEFNSETKTYAIPTWRISGFLRDKPNAKYIDSNEGMRLCVAQIKEES